MNTNGKQTFALITLGVLLVASTGCATARLPWFAKNEESTAMDNYVAQAASNIQYNSDGDMTQDYQPSAPPVSSYTSPPARTASRSSGGGGESCCH